MSKTDNPKPERARRTSLSTLVQFRFNTLEEFLAEYSVDLSPSGIFIRAEELPEVGAAVYLQFSLADGSKLIEGLGKVARVEHGTNPGSSGFAVQFVNFDEPSLEFIRSLCAPRE